MTRQILTWLLLALAIVVTTQARAAEPANDADGGRFNLLVNGAFNFHSFENSRLGEPTAGKSGSVACWDQAAYRDCEVFRATGVTEFLPRYPVEGVVVIHPGKSLSQFVLLSEVELDPGDRVSLSVLGHQSTANSLQASVWMMQVDGAAGEWSPADYKQDDKRTFTRCARGELTSAPGATGNSGADTDFELQLANVEIIDATPKNMTPEEAKTPRPMTIGITVEFRNVSERDVWVYSPCLSRGPRALNRLPAARQVSTLYRHIPRTMQKLWRGEPLHIMHTGYSSDCGDANPPLYFYDEDPKSPTFKQPIQREFDGSLIGHPEWTDYIPRWNLHYMQWGRMRAALLQKYNYSIDRILLNTMACGGSLLCEAHSGFADYAALTIPPGPLTNHRVGKSWAELYPDVLKRPTGAGPDLVVFGFGAKFARNVTHDEVEQYEGAIRWFQRHYPGVEFMFSVNDWHERFTANAGGLRELSLRYGIPMIDFARALHLSNRHYDGRNPMLNDAHPQAYAHYLWFKQIERAFEAVDPIEPGLPQMQLPERISWHTIGWEGEQQTYTAPNARFRQGTAIILDDTTVNVWTTGKEERVQISIDGQVDDQPRLSTPLRNVRNSTFAGGHLSLGDRHIVEVAGPEAKFTAVDCKRANERQWIGIDSPRWQIGKQVAEPFASQWGAPFGSQQLRLAAGETIAIDVPATFFSIAYVDQANGGQLVVEVDGREMLNQPTNVPFRTVGGEELLLENRKAVGPVAYGLHTIRLTAVAGPVSVLGLFSYDTRSNRANERVVRGTAYPGETITFTPPFKARPLVHCGGGLRFNASTTTATQVTFTGDGPGTYEIFGE
jgi:hypothetical protein